jgi:hypothetical protein
MIRTPPPPPVRPEPNELPGYVDARDPSVEAEPVSVFRPATFVEEPPNPVLGWQAVSALLFGLVLAESAVIFALSWAIARLLGLLE